MRCAAQPRARSLATLLQLRHTNSQVQLHQQEMRVHSVQPFHTPHKHCSDLTKHLWYVQDTHS